MSWYPGNNFQFPPPGWFPDSTNSKPSSSGGGFPLPGYGFQLACPPPGGRFFVPESYLPDPLRMQYPNSAMFYNAAQYPPTFIASSNAYPFAMQGIEDHNAYSCPNTDNTCVRAGESQLYSTVGDRTVSEGNTPAHGHPSCVQTYVRHEEQGSQPQNQQWAEEQGHESWEEERSASFRPRRGQEYSKPDKKSNQTFKGEQTKKQMTPQGQCPQWNNHSDVGKDHGFNEYGKWQETKQHKEGGHKCVGQQQPWRENPERGKSDPVHGKPLKPHNLKIPTTRQHGSHQRNAQSEINQRPA